MVGGRARPLLLAALLLGGCPETPCEEDVRAQVLDASVELSIDGRPLRAELADDEVERERGWRYRLCDRDGLLLVPDPGPTSEPLPVFGCALALPVDVAFIHDETVIETHRLEPCDPPCGECPVFGEDLEIDAVLEVPVATWDLPVGTPVTGIP